LFCEGSHLKVEDVKKTTSFEIFQEVLSESMRQKLIRKQIFSFANNCQKNTSQSSKMCKKFDKNADNLIILSQKI
jgi:hypothetical protein